MPAQVRNIDFEKLNILIIAYLLRLSRSLRTLIFAKDSILQESKQQVKSTAKKKKLNDIKQSPQNWRTISVLSSCAVLPSPR